MDELPSKLRAGTITYQVLLSSHSLLSRETPSLELESNTSEKSVPVMPTPTREEANDKDHETTDEVATEPRRSGRA